MAFAVQEDTTQRLQERYSLFDCALYACPIFVLYTGGSWVIHSGQDMVRETTADAAVSALENLNSYEMLRRMGMCPTWYWSEGATRQFFLETGEFPDFGNYTNS